MATMSPRQRDVILAAHENRHPDGLSQSIRSIYPRGVIRDHISDPTERALLRNKWVFAVKRDFRLYVTTAGLVAAGVDMDDIHHRANLLHTLWKLNHESAVFGRDGYPRIHLRNIATEAMTGVDPVQLSRPVTIDLTRDEHLTAALTCAVLELRTVRMWAVGAGAGEETIAALDRAIATTTRAADLGQSQQATHEATYRMPRWTDTANRMFDWTPTHRQMPSPASIAEWWKHRQRQSPETEEK